MSRRDRERLFKGVYRDNHGIAIIVSVQGKPREFRRDATGKPYSQYDRHTLPRVRQQIEARERLSGEREVADATLFPADVARFLATISSTRHRVNTQGYMAHWEAHFAERTRNAITDLDAQTAFAAMQHANSTRVHLRRALIQFYEALNGKSGYNPGRSLAKPAKDNEQVRDLPWPMIERLFAAMQPSRAKARLMLMAYIGLPQKQIKMLKPSDLRLKTREVVVHPRRKGAGVSGRTQPLSGLGMAALKEFARLKAFGPFPNQNLVVAFKSAAKRAGITLPPGARPYDLRHSFLTELARGGADIKDIAHLGMHATLEQAARYVKGAAAERATKAITSVPRFRATTSRGKSPKRSHSVTSKRARTGTRSQGKKRRIS